MLSNNRFMKLDGRTKRFIRLKKKKADNYSDSDFEVGNNVPLATQNEPKGASKQFQKLGTYFCFKSSKVHAENLDVKKWKTFDPRGKAWQQWHSIFLFSCLAALFIDPLFFYLPVVDSNNVCLFIDERLTVIITVLRTITDIFHLIHIGVLFRTGFIVPTSSGIGGGEIVNDPVQIAKHYLSRQFILDLIAVLPLPQLFIWVVVPGLKGTAADNTKTAVRFIILIQLLPRIYPLTQQMGKATSRLHTETAWGGAAYNLLLYMLISHFFGGFFYLLAVERQNTCWRDTCDNAACDAKYLDCSVSRPEGYLLNITDLQASCGVSGSFDYGIYNNALQNGITSTSKFLEKFFYCLWFGLQNLSTLGQGLGTSSYDGEVIFSIIIVIVGLTLFARLIGNMQSFLQSMTLRLEEMRLKRQDMDQWMQHRQIYPELRKRVRNYEQYKWLETRGVHEEELIQTFPKDLKRDIKRHLCLSLVKKVPLLKDMDDQLLDAMCECLQPTLFTSGTNVLQEGDPVDEMLFITRGTLSSVTTNGGRTGFLNEGKLEAGHFCGEELLTWALDPKSGGNFPSSSRSVTTESEVEAFSLKAEDLKFVASQFRRLHSKQVQHTFRHYSQHWRTWAACSIQAAWRRHKRRKLAELYNKEEEEKLRSAMQESGSGLNHLSLGAAFFASRFAANAMRGVHRLRSLNSVESIPVLRVPKPTEPDFSDEDDEL